jgi:uncharacterized membrane protein
MTVTLWIVVIHVMSSIALVGGMLGRELARVRLRRTTELNSFLVLLDLVGQFENILVRPGSLAVAASGILLAVLEGYPLFGFLQGGQVNWLFAANLLVLSIVAIIVLVFIPRGKRFDAQLAEAKRKGEITPDLRAEDADPVVVWAHRWENIAIFLVVFLMIAKPF